MSDLAVCTGCGALQAWTRMACQGCGARSFTPATLPVPGTIYSITTVRRAPDPASTVPYSVALVRGAQGGLVMVPWDGPLVAIGDPVLIMQGTTGLVAQLEDRGSAPNPARGQSSSGHLEGQGS